MVMSMRRTRSESFSTPVYSLWISSPINGEFPSQSSSTLLLVLRGQNKAPKEPTTGRRFLAKGSSREALVRRTHVHVNRGTPQSTADSSRQALAHPIRRTSGILRSRIAPIRGDKAPDRWRDWVAMEKEPLGASDAAHGCTSVPGCFSSLLLLPKSPSQGHRKRYLSEG